MRVLVTRPHEDATSTADALRHRGHDAIVSPLLRIQYKDNISFADVTPQALVITSANGIRAFARCDERRDLMVLAVGNASAAAARQLGFRYVIASDGDIDALAETVCLFCTPDQGPLVHPAGEAARGELKDLLQAKGFEVLRRDVYAAVAVDRVSEELRASLAASGKGAVEAVLFYSARTALTFKQLVCAHSLETSCRGLTACCLSDAVANALEGLVFRKISIAKRKHQHALLDLLDME